MGGRVRPTQERWQTLQPHDWCGVSGLKTNVPNRVTDSNREAGALRWLHMRPIQWHVKKNWRVPETMAKVIPIPKSFHPHLKWWLEESSVLQGQPLQPTKTCYGDFYRCIKRRVGCSLKRVLYKGRLVPFRKQTAHKLSGTKGGLSGPKRVQDLCSNNIVLIATDNSTVVAYINKEGGMKSGPLCALCGDY